MNRLYRLLVVVAPWCLVACGGTDEAPVNQLPTDGIRDVRVTIPEPDAIHMDFVGPEQIIQPGEDKLYCTHFRYDGEDAAFNQQETFQGKFGHHSVLLAAKEPLPPGTTEDCSDVEAMSKFDAFTLPTDEMPAGLGTFLPKGKQFVLQSHYLNTDSMPIRVRDVVRLKMIPIESVQKWASMYATNTYELDLQPHKVTDVQFDCTVPSDVRLLLFGGHMHEWGARFEASIGPDANNLESAYLVDEWKTQYRDSPPITLFFSNPKPLTTGMVLRTHCTFNNTTDQVIGFPHEMCSTFGLVEGSKDPITCIIGEKSGTP
jgi:hypothetical protein